MDHGRSEHRSCRAQHSRGSLMSHTGIVLVGLAATLPWGGVAAGLTAADRCESSKLTASGKLSSCQLRTAAKAASGETADASACQAKFAATWARAEARGMGQCPSTGDAAAIQGLISQCTDHIADALAGGPLFDCPAELTACNADLASCQGTQPLGLRLKTGQTTCYTSGGFAISCAGTGQEGELQKGLDPTYVDNGDGTITDVRTGLMWEKLSQDGSIHDYRNFHTWTQTFSVHIAGLNSANFAGHSDWRLPNVNELHSLARYGAFAPAVEPIFNTGCTSACTATTCSCTQSDFYWSSTTYQNSPVFAWGVSITDVGFLGANQKANGGRVRAVRGGS